MGGLTIVILLFGRMPQQNAFLQLPCLRVRQCLATMLTRRRIVSGQRTGTYFSDLVHMRSLWLPRMTIRDFALTERMHMVGIARGVSLARRALYYARHILI